MAAKAKIDIELGNGQKAGQTITQLKQQANRLTKEINNLTPGTDKFVKKTAELQKVGGRLKEVRKEVKGTTEATNGLTQSFTGFLPFSGQLGTILGGVRGLTGGFKGLRLAIIATGLGALVLVVTSLVSWFSRTEKGAQALRVIMAAIGQVTDSLMDVLVNLGEAIFNAFSNPKQAIEDFGNSIKDFVLGRVELLMSGLGKLGEAFNYLFDGEFKKALKSAGEGFVEFNRGVNPAIITMELLADGTKAAIAGTKELFTELQSDANAAMQLAKDENALRVKNRAFLIEEAQYRAEIAQLREWATDVTRTDEERQAALAKAIGLTNEVEAKKIALKQEQLRILKAQQQISITDEAGLEQAAQLEAELIQLQEARASSMRRLTAQESALRLRMTTEQQKAIDDSHKKEIKARENLQNLALELMEAGIEKEIAKINLDTERKIEALIGTEAQIREQKAILQDIEEQRIQDVKDKYADIAAKKDDENKKDEIKRARELARAKDEIQAAGLSAFNQSVDAGISILSRDEAARKKNAEAIKAFETARVSVGLAAEIQAIWEYANKNPANALFPGAAQAIAIVKTVAATGRAAVSLRQINSQKFESGGLLSGPRHAFGGIPAMVSGQPIEMEGGEFVFSRRAVQGIGADVLSSINTSFANGGPINPLAPPSTIARQAANNLVPAASQAPDQLIAAFNSFRGEIATWQRSLSVQLNLQATKKGIETLQTLEDDASV